MGLRQLRDGALNVQVRQLWQVVLPPLLFPVLPTQEGLIVTAEQAENVVQLPQADWTEKHPLEHRPQALDAEPGQHLANHKFTISFTPKGAPMVVVRGESAEEVNEGLNELEELGVYANIAAAQSTMLALGPIGGMLGTVSAMDPTPPSVPPQAPAQAFPQAAPAWGPPQPSPGPAPFGAAPQWGQQPVAGAAPAGFSHRIAISFNEKDNWKSFKEAVLRPLGAGASKWDPASKTWLLSPAAYQVVMERSGGRFGTPTPA